MSQTTTGALSPAEMLARKRASPQEFTSVPSLKPPNPAHSVGTADAHDVSGHADSDAEQLKRAEEIREKQQHPLKRFSLRGASAHLERMASEQKALLDALLLSGQASAWYAPPNTGKSLICLALLVQAIEEGRIEGDNVFYVNVDDTSRGLAEKVGLLEQLNVHTLGEGENRFTASSLIPAVRELIDTGKAKGLFIILDTLKKFVSVMDKKESAAFATLCRQFVLKGGTLLCLGHTNKRPDQAGKLIHAGTSDIPDDFDCIYLISTRPDQPSETERIVEFQNTKRRGDVDARAVYSYTLQERISYDQRLASVTKLDASGFLPIEEAMSQERESATVRAIVSKISEGPIQKMALARAVSHGTGLGRHKVIAIIDKYTGGDASIHRWQFKLGARGMKLFELLDQPATEQAPTDR